MPALAITDHGVLSGIIQFYQQCRKAGDQAHHRARGLRGGGPLPQGGAERGALAPHPPGRERHRLPQPAEAGQPRLPRGLLLQAAHGLRTAQRARRGLICLSGCASGRLSRALQNGQIAAAEAEVERLVDIFGEGDVYLEMQETGIDELAEINPAHGRSWRRRPGSSWWPPTTSTTCARADAARARRAALHPDRVAAVGGEPHALLLRGVLLQERRRDAGRVPRPSRGGGQHPRGGGTLQRRHRARRACSSRTSRCPRATTRASYLRHQCELGLVRRYGDEVTPEVRERLEIELAVVEKMGFPPYFLIVWDFVTYAKNAGIPVGPGPRLGRRLAGVVPAGHHRPRPAHVRPALRALPQPRPHQHARHRHRLLGERPGEGHRLRGQQVRARPGGADRHLRHHQGPAGHPRRRPGHGRALQPGRPHRQAGARGAQHHPRRLPDRRQGRPAPGLRQREDWCARWSTWPGRSKA